MTILDDVYYLAKSPKVIQFLQIVRQVNVPMTMEQHAMTQGTSWSGGNEQAQTRHIK